MKTVFKKENIQKVIDRNPDIDPSIIRLIIMGIANGAIRPAGQSYRDALAKGEFHHNGHEVLDNFLASTSGQLVFQEQILVFLNQFCGFSMGEADIVRRGFAKKEGTEKYIPRIKNGFIDTMVNQHNETKEHAEEIIDQFLVVIEDASDYIFSKNHADPYSMIGFATAYLRLYHPIEFLTTLLNINVGKMDKTTDIANYMKEHTDIQLKPAQFRFSKSEYAFDKQTNTIYKGIGSIKDIGKHVGDELSKFYNNQYTSLISLLDDIYQYDNKIALETYEKSLKEANKPIKKAYADSIKEGYTKEQLKQDDVKSKLKELRSAFNGKLDLEVREKLKEFKVDNPTNALVGKAMLEILAKLSFFKEFGKSNKILQILDAYDEFRQAKQFNKNKLAEMDGRWQDIIVKYANKETESVYSELDTESIINDIIDLIEDEDISVDESLLFQKEKLGYISNGIIENPPSNYCVVDKIYKNKNQSAYLKLKTLTGKEFDAKISRQDLNWSIEDGTILELRKITKKYRYKLVGKNELTGKNEYDEDRTQPKIMWFLDYRIIKSEERDGKK